MSFSLYLSFGYRNRPNNGKELDKMHGLNMYDYSARYMEPAIGRFTSVDPLAELYYNISPYAYVANNTLRFIDLTGMTPVDSVDWQSFDPANDDIDLNEVVVTPQSRTNSPSSLTYWANFTIGTVGTGIGATSQYWSILSNNQQWRAAYQTHKWIKIHQI